MTDQPLSPLPDLLARIADAAGEEAALLVAQEWGGRLLYLPKVFRTDHRLVELIGEDRARKIFAELGNGMVTIPLGPYAGAAERRRIAAAALEAGKSHQQAAKDARVHLRTVERLAAKMRDDRQGDLF